MNPRQKKTPPSSRKANPRAKAPSVVPSARLAGPRAAPSFGTVPSGNQACVWMRAGVLRYRLCDRDLDCEHCILDAALQGRGSQAPWTSGDWGPSGYRLFPQDRQFSPAHAWVQAAPAGGLRIGLDALAVWLVGDIVGVRLPAPGTAIQRGQPIATLVAKAGELSLPSPIDGVVRAHNQLVSGCPELVTAAPYGAGWLVEIDRSGQQQRKQLPSLLSGAEAEVLSRGQLHQFHQRVDRLLAERTPSVGPTLADGGEPLTDPCALLGPGAYLKLVQELLS